ncbi:hypothetical protein [Lacticigenium naphthae]|uniref:hypothetical protein n=1 Tax=Lacticigenium naphthae TaxID=515351 RepID=UPI000485A276|nr:hypothetical protein [Lacticigenium naphthae]
METVYLISGTVLVLITIGDLIWTALWVDGGAGPISNGITTFIWKIMVGLNRKKSSILTVSGPVILTLTLLGWILLLWAGWTLIFAGSPQSIIDTAESQPITWNDLIYYAGYVLFTLGNGGFAPANAYWQIMTTVATGTGMLFLTLGASYILSIVNAVVRKRSFASSVLGIGKSAEEIVAIAWDGEGFSHLDLLLNTLASELSTLTQQHKAYPLLHYYHTHKPTQAITVAVPTLDDALSMIEQGTPKKAMPNPLLMKEMRSSIEEYLETLNQAFIEPSDKVPPIPSMDLLRKKAIPVLPEEEFKENMKSLEGRRKKLLGLMTADNWDWDNDR